MKHEIQIGEPQAEETLYGDVCQIIDGARNRIATYMNTEVCMTNWYVGKRIKEDVLYNQRAQYGKQILMNLSVRLTEKYGNGWSLYKFQHCVRAAYTFLEEEIMYATRTQFNTEHIEYLMLDDNSPIKVAQYYTQLPDKKVLAQKLKKAIAVASEHYIRSANLSDV